MTVRDAEFERFVRRRQQLNEELDSSRVLVDDWIAEHAENEASISELATLEGLLMTRRELLSQLAALDDTFMTHLLTLRHSAQE